MKRFTTALAAMAACLILLNVSVVLGQSGNVQLGGLVEDSTKALIPGVTVTATNVDTNVTQTTLSNDSGTYSFAALPPGKYQVSADLTGFKKVVNNDVILPYAGQVRLNFTMEIGLTNQTVNVVTTAESQLRESSASVGDVLTRDQIQNLPLVGQNLLDLLVTLPGFRQTPGSETGDSVNGLNMDSVNVTRDGITVNDVRNSTTIYGTNTLSTTVLLPELVGEVRMILAPVDAELGRGNSQLQISTRSGTNRYTGSAGWNVLNSALNANTWTNNHTAFTDPFSGDRYTYTPKTWTNQHQITFSFGGPLSIPGLYDGKNKTFFYGVYSKNIRGTREQIATTVLTDTARLGIFRYWSGYNPVGWASTASTVYPMQATTATLIAVDQDGRPVRPVANPASTTSDPAGAGFIPYSGNLVCFSVFGTQRLDENGGMVPFDPIADCPGGQGAVPTGRPSWDQFRPSGDTSGLIAKFLRETPKANYYGSGDGLNYAQIRWIRGREGTSDTTGALAGTNPNANITSYNLKLDHNFTASHKVSGSWTFQQDSSAVSPPGYPNGLFGTTNRWPHTLAINGTSTLSPRMVNEARFGLTYTKNFQAPPWEHPDEATKNAARDLMLPAGNGVRNTDYQYLALVNSASGAVATSNGFMGTTLMSNYQRSLAYTMADTLSWSTGKHAFKFGVDWRLTNTAGNGGSQAYPTVNLGNASNATTSPFSTTSNFNTPADSTGYLPGLLATARGNVVSLLQYQNGSVASVAQNYWIDGAANVGQGYWDDISTQGERIRKQFGQNISAFVKDDFKVTKRLTLNLGLRWDFFGSPYFENGLTSTLKDGGYGAFGASRTAQASLEQFNADPFSYFLRPGNLYLSGYGSVAPSPLTCIRGAQQNALLPVSTCDPSSLSSVQFIGPDTPNPDVRAVPANYGNFGPAIGFAYQLPWFGEGKTTIRGGYQQTFGSAGTNAGTLGGGTEGTLGNAPGAVTSGTLAGHINESAFSSILATRAINLSDINTLVPMKPDQPVPGAALSVYGLSAGPQALLGWSVYDPNLKSNYTQNITLSVTRQVSRSLTVEARYTGTLGRRLSGWLDINQNNVYYNPEMMQALTDVRAGTCTANAEAYRANYTDKGINPCNVNNDPVLFDQLLAGLNLNNAVVAGATNPQFGVVGANTLQPAGTPFAGQTIYQTGAQHLRRSGTFQNNLSYGVFDAVADSLISLAPTPAQGRQALPIDPSTGVAITNVGQTGLRNACDRMGNGAAYVQQTITMVGGTPVVAFQPGFNASNATPLRCFPEDFLHSNPQFGSTGGTSVRYNTNTGRSSYNSLQMQVTARPIQGVSASATWVWAKSFNLPGSGYMDPNHRDLDFAVQGLNAHSLRTNATLELPIGPNKLLLGNSSGWLARVVERWQTSFIYNASSPVYATLNPGQSHFYAASGYNVVSPNWSLPKSDFKWIEGTNNGNIYGDNYISVTDPSCYNPAIVTMGDRMGTNLGRIDANPTTGAPAAGACTIAALAARNPDGTAGEILLQYPEPGKVGNLGKSNMKGIGQWTLDVSASKSFNVSESKSFQFRIDANNVLNHPVPNNPNISAGPPGIGVITGKGGQVRTVQASLRINF